jgi:hypothetical protein
MVQQDELRRRGSGATIGSFAVRLRTYQGKYRGQGLVGVVRFPDRPTGPTQHRRPLRDMLQADQRDAPCTPAAASTALHRPCALKHVHTHARAPYLEGCR